MTNLHISTGKQICMKFRVINHNHRSGGGFPWNLIAYQLRSCLCSISRFAWRPIRKITMLFKGHPIPTAVNQCGVWSRSDCALHNFHLICPYGFYDIIVPSHCSISLFYISTHILVYLSSSLLSPLHLLYQVHPRSEY